ncbi:MAG TPA: SGNH/GDSL hydrolase family protein [Candidatus Paceibacterota bacterium]|nr:SGNH/GDSL hydrolase family protein [Candidatus Paceibacterota bacterium]
MKLFFRRVFSFALPAMAVAFTGFIYAAETALEPKPSDPFFARFEPIKAPAPDGLILKTGDRLAIIGDSITEQKMYSRIIETYLTVCVPDLKITARQYGWSGETAEGFLRRMTNDCLRFKPTVATLCYGMNDHRYAPFKEEVGNWYRDNYAAVARSLKTVGARVVLGSAGCVGRTPRWAPDVNTPPEELNLNLCQLRNIDIGIAEQEHIRFADVFWPMFTAFNTAHQKYGADYAVPGKDGVHPDWAGHTIMAYAFLKAMGLDGDIGTFTVDFAAGKATATAGHKVESFETNALTITSSRYPFCATGATDKDNSIRSGMTLVPFNAELNRLKLVVKGGSAANYAVTWGSETRTYSAEQLAAGVNLADDFAVNPFSEAFAKVDNAVAEKQKYETRQIKELFHGPEGKADLGETADLTEKVRDPLAKKIAETFVPVTHTIRIQPQ